MWLLYACDAGLLVTSRRSTCCSVGIFGFRPTFSPALAYTAARSWGAL